MAAPAVIVEDGSIVENSNSYVSVPDFKTYCDEYGYDISTKTADEKFLAVLEACNYLNALEWIGDSYEDYRVMAFPRQNVGIDDSVPGQVIDLLAANSLVGNITLYASEVSEKVKRETVAVITTEYFSAQDADEVTNAERFPYIYGLLKSLLAPSELDSDTTIVEIGF